MKKKEKPLYELTPPPADLWDKWKVEPEPATPDEFAALVEELWDSDVGEITSDFADEKLVMLLQRLGKEICAYRELWDQGSNGGYTLLYMDESDADDLPTWIIGTCDCFTTIIDSSCANWDDNLEIVQQMLNGKEN